jgi:hypothetical protein
VKEVMVNKCDDWSKKVKTLSSTSSKRCWREREVEEKYERRSIRNLKEVME